MGEHCDSVSPLRRPGTIADLEIQSPDLGALSLHTSDVEEDDGASCSICFERVRAVRCRPCGHALSCGLCTVRAINPVTKDYHCPACRTAVTKLEWHGGMPSLRRMATDGRQLSAGVAVCSTVHDFLQARAAGDDEPLAEAAGAALALWGRSREVCEAEALLIAAAEAGDVSVVASLMERGEVDLNATDAEGWTALIAAASEAHLEIVRALLAVPSVAVNAANNDQETALIRAVACGHEAVVHALLANVSTLGLDVNLTTRSGRSALIIAAASGNTALVAALLAIDGIDTDTTDRDGLTALRHAVAGGHAEAASAIRVHNRRQLQEELRSERAAITQRGRDP